MSLPIQLELKVFWIIGFVLSTLALMFQVFIYILVPWSRKLSVKLLTHMTIARLMNVALEYTLTNVQLANPVLNEAVYALYMQTDAALICWMFVFTKNLYEDIIIVFTEKINLTIVTVIIWLVTCPVGLLCPFMMQLDISYQMDTYSYFDIYYKTYAIIKFIILFLNLILFGIIFKVALSRGRILRTCIVSFGLVSISSLLVFINDILTFSTDPYPMVSFVFGVINAYQILAITALFVILVQNFSEQPLTKVVTRKLAQTV